MATVGGDEMREMGFAQTEHKRLKYAWELVVLFRHNASELEGSARWLHSIMSLTAFLTTVCAVLLTASHEEPKQNNVTVTEMVSFDEAIDLDPGSQRALSLMCAVVTGSAVVCVSTQHPQ